MKKPIRTCLGCRKHAEKGELLRIVVQAGVLVVDDSACAHGRGVYLHLNEECLRRLIAPRAWERGLRLEPESLSPQIVAGFLQELRRRVVAQPSKN